MKLDYHEILPCLKEVTRVWEDMLTFLGRPQIKLDHHKLHNAVKAGTTSHTSVNHTSISHVSQSHQSTFDYTDNVI